MKTMRTLVMMLSAASAGVVYAESGVDYYDDIRPVMEHKCLTCHSEDSVSFSFEDPETTYQFRAAISDAVAARRMPPWLAEPGHQEYADDYSLDEDEVALFERWAQASHPRGEPRDADTANVIEAGFDAQLTLDVQPDFAYLPNQRQKDDYRCFLIDWPYEQTKYVTAFKAEPGNLRIAHHLVLYVVPPSSAEFMRTIDREEPGHGHQCFGGVIPDKLADDEAALDAVEQRFPGAWDRLGDEYYWLSHWAPGVVGFEFPEGTGVRVAPGSVLVAQMHYYSAYAPGESDAGTRMLFRIADAVDKPSINYPMTRRDWIYAEDNGSMVIPAGETRMYETSVSFTDIARRASQVLHVDAESIDVIELHSANLHMHAYGASGVISMRHTSGQKETLLNIPDWDLDWQRDFQFTAAKNVMPGEFDSTRLIVECTYDNYSENTVYGGFGSYDEMCFNFSYVSLVMNDAAQASESDSSKSTSP